MTVNSSGLELYHLTLQRQSNYVHSCVGHFVDPLNSAPAKRKSRKDYQVCIATETHVELFNVEEGEFQRLTSVPIFATITAMQSLPVETNYSYLVLVTDAGNLSLLQFVNDMGTIRLHSLFNEPFSRSGLRRVAPQRYLQVDPQGRCLFLSATERNRLCYQTDFKNNTLNVSSPLEFRKPNCITIATAVCDVAFDNPVYACLEIDCADQSRHLAFYMLDVGLNHIIQQQQYAVPQDTNFIFTVPNLEKYGINTRPSSHKNDFDDMINPFVIMATTDRLLLQDARGLFKLQVMLPVRSTSVTIISAAVHKLKKEFFMLLQAHNGDLYKVKIVPNEAESLVPLLSVSFFDNIEPSSKLHIFRNGLLMALQEYSGYKLYEFESLGDDANVATSNEHSKVLELPPSPSNLENLSIIQYSKNLNPIVSVSVSETTPLTILAQSKNGLQQLTSGIDFEELITSPLPPNAAGIWSIRFALDSLHRLVFLKLPKATMILQIDEGTLEELAESNNHFKTDGDTTIFVGLMGKRSIVQVCENCMLQVDYDLNTGLMNLKNEWLPPAGIRVLHASCSLSQLALALSNNEIVYFEIDTSSGLETLNEAQSRIELPERITALSLPQCLRSDFLAVGCADSSVKVIQLRGSDEDNFLEVVSIQVLLSSPYSLNLASSNNALLLHIGLDSGVYIRSSVDKVNGQLFDTRTKYIGPKPVKISALSQIDYKSMSLEEDDDDEASERIDQISCAVLHCEKTWLSYEIGDLLCVKPIVLPRNISLEAIADFKTSDLKSNGCCAISSRGSLMIGRFGHFTELEKWFHQEEINTDEDSTEIGSNFNSRFILPDSSDGKVAFVVENHSVAKKCRISICRSGSLLEINSDAAKYLLIDGTCLSAQISRFGTNDCYLVLASNTMKLQTFSVSFKNENGKRIADIKLLHETSVGEKVHAMAAFRDKLLVPIANNLVLYAMGRKQLLKKSISTTPPSITKIVHICQWEDRRIAIGDIHESVTLLLFDKRLNQFISVADDVVKRHVTAVEFLDKSTVIGGDRFGNIWALRVPQSIEKMLDEEYIFFLSKFLGHSQSDIPRNIMECPCKWELVSHFYANDIPTSFRVLKNLNMSDRACVIYTGLQGTIACLVPLITKGEVEFMHKLEDGIRDSDETFFMEAEANRAADARDEFGPERPPNSQSKLSPRPLVEGAFSLVGRDHVAYRSYYVPVKGVVDGDMCEQFLHLYPSEQEFLVKKLKLKNVSQIKSRLAEVRTNHV
ncbi:LADA_0B02784g1_1 [Lachancea dasiensis]|uniref:LADA_0B02784g1_1 n=1 Tax=Lachancea dasiensis TaxID=1072105 RepID=A0A1G4IS78_9SACH|nr:LADA_0B02784g1_1 [Lachancea dasiensis]